MCGLPAVHFRLFVCFFKKHTFCERLEPNSGSSGPAVRLYEVCPLPWQYSLEVLMVPLNHPLEFIEDVIRTPFALFIDPSILS